MDPDTSASARRDERRQFPRVALATPVQVEGPRGGRWLATSVDVSRGGMQLRCAQADAFAMVAECRSAAATQEVQLTLRLGLAAPAAAALPLVARARVVYVRPLGGDLVLLGVEFTGYEGSGYESLQAYVIESLRY
jgi:c-di-GMP-binding flagellar brake protein YcgR